MPNDTNAADVILTLTPEDASLLKELLTNDLQNLREEVYKTEDYDWRQELKRREAVMRGLLERLHVGPAGGADRGAVTTSP